MNKKELNNAAKSYETQANALKKQRNFLDRVIRLYEAQAKKLRKKAGVQGK